MLQKRAAVTRMQGIIVIAVLVVAVGGAYLLNSGTSQSNPTVVVLSIVETDPVNQVDSLNPANITVPHDTTFTLAIQNHDDAPRSLEISAFNVNQTIGSGATERVTITVGQPGVFQIYVPPRGPYMGFKASPSLTGYLIVS